MPLNLSFWLIWGKKWSRNLQVRKRAVFLKYFREGNKKRRIRVFLRQVGRMSKVWRFCHMRIKLHESGEKCAKTPARCGKRARELQCEGAGSLQTFARKLQGLRSWFKLQKIWYDHGIIIAELPSSWFNKLNNCFVGINWHEK
jgi:hypothetical protein